MIDAHRVDREEIRLQLGDLLDLEEVRRFRASLTKAGEAPASIQLDLSRVRSADGAAILLLEADLPAALGELELSQHMQALAVRNAHASSHACFLGGGSYDHFVPAVVEVARSEGQIRVSGFGKRVC